MKFYVKIVLPLTLIALTYFGIGYFTLSPWKPLVAKPDTNLVFNEIEYVTQNIIWKGWEFTHQDPQGLIIVLHGYKHNRIQLIERSDFFHNLGLIAIFLDLPAHGQSTGKLVKFGLHEAKALSELIHQVRLKYNDLPLIVNGFSLGAAVAVMNLDPGKGVDGYVLEGIFNNMDEAIENRIEIYLGRQLNFLKPLITWQANFWIGQWPKQISPISFANKIKVPVLFMAGANDRKATRQQQKRFFDKIQASKKWVLFHNAKHEDLYKNDKQLFKLSFRQFIEKNKLIRH